MTQGAINAIVFGVEGPTNRYLCPRISEGPWKEVKIGLCSGTVGGFLQTFVCAPTELVKLRMQHQAIGELTETMRKDWATFKDILARGGVRGCFQGFWVTAFRDTPAFAVYFATYEGSMHYIAKKKGISKKELSHKLLYPFICGGITGIVTWSINYPVDLIKTRIQLDGANGEMRQYRNSWDCFIKAWKEGGVRLLYRGLIPCYVRAFANSSFLFVAVEVSKRVFNYY